MKKLLTFFLTALLAFGVGWAATTVTFVAGTDKGSYTSQHADQISKDGVTIACTSAALGRDDNYRIYSGSTTTISVDNGTITKIQFTNVSGYANTLLSLYESSGTYSNGTWTGSSSQVKFKASAQYRATQIAVTVETGGGSTVAAPTISPAGGSFLTTQEVTLSHADGGTIYYTLDGSDPTTSSTQYSTPITLTSTTTVKAIAVKDGVTSTVASATFTKTGVANIAEALDVTQGSTFTFTGNAVVTYQNGRYVWIRDNSGSGLIFRKSGETSTLNNGDILDANWTATNTTYNSIPEFSNPTGVTSSNSGGTVAPFDMTSTGITTDDVNKYVSFSNVTTSWDDNMGYVYVTINNNKVYFRNDFIGYNSTGLTATSGGTYNIEGIAYMQNGNAFVYMTKVTAVSPILTATPNPLTFNDSGTDNSFTVEGSNLGTDNVGLTQSGSNFTPTLTATTGSPYDGVYNGSPYWGFTPANGSVNGTVAMSYSGRELSASETVTLANNKASTTVTVNYRADVYILGNYGNSGWDYSNGILMTYDDTNNTYTATVTAEVDDLIVFARKLGESNPWNSRILFGPNSTGDCWVSGNFTGTIDLNDDDPIYFNSAGTYTIEINATTGALKITKEVVNTGDFELVTNVNDLNAGDEIIFVNQGTAGSAYAMSTSQANNRPGTAVTVTNGLKVTATDATQIFTLEGSSSGWYFHTVNGDNQGYIYAASSSSNYLKTETTADDNAKATISLANDGAATIIFQGTYTRNRLRYNPNNGSPIFACYSSSSTTGNLAYIYKRSASTEPEITVNPSSLELVIPAGGSSQSGSVTVTESNTTGTTDVIIDGDTNIFSTSLDNGTLTVTYSGSATQANPDQATITLSNGSANATVTVTGYKEPLTVTITPADGHTFQGSTVTGIIESNVTGATIEYSFDGTTWQTYDANNGFTATVNTVGGTVTVYARATYNGETANAQATYTRVPQSATCTADIVFAPTSNGGNLSTWSGLQGHISEGADYVSDATVSSLITSTTYNAIRFGSSSYIGEFDFTLDLTKFEGSACKLTKVTIKASRYYTSDTNYDSDCQLKVSTSADANGKTVDITNQNGFADYVFNFDGSEVTSISIANTTAGKRVYVRSISLEYNCGASLEAPVITPASGTYYEDQNVEITAETGATIYYTTDGTDPATSNTRLVYNDSFAAEYTAGGTTTIKAVAVKTEGGEEIVSEVATVTYAWGMPTVTIIPGSTNVTSATTIPVTITDMGAADAVIYYTTDGSTPNENSPIYTGSFDVTLADVGDEVTVKAIVVSHNYTSSVATATYKYVENTIDMIDPYFSPMCNHTYYGDQTVEILCPIPGAIMYYEIAEANGTTAPSANEVTQPSRGSSQYGEPIALTVGKSYYIKAVAYVGNNVSNIIEGWYIIRPTSDWTGPNATVLESVSELQTVSSGTTVTFRNPVQVVYMSKFTNDPTPTGYDNPIPEFCYVRDNTGYGLIYFGKAATEWAQQTDGRTNSPATFFNMGDWVDGSQIVGKTGTWSSGLIPQLGTNSHDITSWPDQTIGHTRIMAEPTTCAEINAANTVENNLCGHYVHLRNTTIDWAEDQKPNATDPDYRNFGRYSDGTATASMYDRFWLFSGTQTYTFQQHDYMMKGMGDYNTAFFNYYQDKGATFDIFAIGAYYTGTFTHDGETEDVKSEILPIDYLWIYPPTIVTPNDSPYEGQATIEIEGDTVSWSGNTPTIYYRTDDMEDWAVYDPQNPPVITSSTTVYTYTELPAVKTDGTDYSDFVHSNVVQKSYIIEGIDDPVISPVSQLVDISDGPQTLQVTVTTGEGCTSVEGVYYTVYTTDGSTPYWNSADDYNGTIIEGTAGANNSFVISETTTVTAVTYYVLDGEVELVSNIESETYTFVKKNGVTYNILTDAPQVGTIVVIVNKAHNMAMSTTQNETNRGSVGVLFTDDTKDVVYGNDEIAQFVVESAGANRYYLKNVNGGTPGYLYVNSNSANLLTESTLDNEGKAASNITIGAASNNVNERYIATVTFAYEGTTRYLRYYDNGHAFSTYSDGSLHEDVFLYGIEATPLSFIEENKHNGDHVVVSDQLVGTWAVEDGNTKLLWVKDQGNRSIIPTYNDLNAIDYMMDYCRSNPQKTDWDQSNWAIIDFSNQTVSPTLYVNKVIQGSTIVGTYTDELNYTIVLDATSEGGVEPVIVGQAEGYYGYLEGAHGDPLEVQYNDYSYNHYTTVNFLEKNLNDPWGPGAKAGENARAAQPGTPMFFMNPKIMEVAHVWGVYDGLHGNYHRFDIYENSGSNNGFDLEGSFDVLSWDYNRVDDDNYGMPDDLIEGKAYMFHVVVARENFQYGYRAASMMRGAGTAESASSNSMGAYPLDLLRGGGSITAVKDVKGAKEVESVRFYNLMGVESMTPFEGINIVVTRYTDGSMTSRKVMR
ncbi:MAG: chitobiase/beta-hexosaminidase C-terminal domain-containing protein [Muribaculaceae bacterium]|nr:chitobiase/beta-hexosaminidase C-terminal domain-containing protein [Muribaculaceae bacterium]